MLAQLGEGPAELPPQVGSQFRACRQGLLLGFGGRPAQPKDLGPVHAAAAMDAADTASAAPPLHRLGPLLSQVVLTEPLKHAHQLAVQHPGRGGIELTGDGRHRRPHRSESRPSTTSPAKITACASATRPIAAAAGLPIDPTTIARLAQVRAAVQVAPHQAVVALDHREPGMRWRIVVPLEQSLRSFDPAADRGHQRGIHQTGAGRPESPRQPPPASRRRAPPPRARVPTPRS